MFNHQSKLIVIKIASMKTWIFAHNPMLSATETSYLSAMNISIFHDHALMAAKNDPFFVSMYNLYHPFHLSYKSAYETWKSQGGIQQGDTLTLSQLLQLLTKTKIQQWDVQIQSKYPQNSAQYKRLLPNRRIPFQTGTQVERMNSVQVLSKTIGTDEALTATKTDIDSFYGQITAANTEQKVGMNNIKSMSSEVEAARIVMCNAQYANMGALIQKFNATPEKIEAYFDLSTIRRSRQVVFTGHVKAGEVYTIVRHTFGETDQIDLLNSGNAALKFYLAGAKDARPGTQGITLAKGEQTVLASALGKLTDAYLMVMNTDQVLKGEFEIEIL